MITESPVRPYQLLPLSRILLGLTTAFLLLAFVLCVPTASQAAANPKELLDDGRADDALRLLAPQATGNNAEALNDLCRVYFSLSDWDSAVRNCERAAQLEPANAIFQLWLGRSYGEKANASVNPVTAYSLARKTVAAFITARSLDRGDIAIARDLAEYYAMAPAIVGGGSDKALGLAAELAPEHPSDAAWVRAMVAANGNRHEQAEHEYTEAVRLDHDSARTYLDLARYLRGRKIWDRFQITVERAIQSPHIRPVDHYDAAELLLNTNRNLPLAAQQMRAYIQGSHTEEEAPLFRAHFLLGEILLKSGDTSQAVAEYKAALALASSYRPAAESLRRLGQR
jgi:tetratricopeptide (TPR) repeat protein